mgnify:CR=1 FL=1
MTKIKLCGLTRPCDIQTANQVLPEYIGFVFAAKSKRCITPNEAANLKRRLHPFIQAVGVFVQEKTETIAELLNTETIDLAQLHGGEDENYIHRLRRLTDKPLIQAFRIETKQDMAAARASTADYVLLDSGPGGTGTTFDWTLLTHIDRPYFLAGGLYPGNVQSAVEALQPYAVDVSSGIETAGKKDPEKMAAFVHAVREK